MSRKVKAILAISAIIMAISAYLGYTAFINMADAMQADDIWTDLD